MTASKQFSFVAALFLLVGLGWSLPARAVTIADLGTLGGSSSNAEAINNLGQVVGAANTGGGSGHAFIWTAGVMTDLGTLGGPTSRALALNDAGQVVGTADTVGGSPHAVLYSNGGTTDLGTLGGTDSFATGINFSGQIVGSSGTGSGDHAFLWENGNMADVHGSIGGSNSVANAINTSGQIVGFSASNVPHGQRAFLGTSGETTDLSGVESIATANNDAGQVVGYFGAINHAFLHSSGVTTDLGTLGGNVSQAYGVNNLGQVVGLSQISPGSGVTHGFLYSNGVMHDLNDLLPAGSGWLIDRAADINDHHQVVGAGYHDGEFRAFLMTIPEPSTLSLALLGAIAVGLASRLRKRP